MALLSKAEAAQRLGYSIELVDWLVENNAKPGEGRRLRSVDVGGTAHFNEEELDRFSTYLSQPWPVPPRGRRPHIPVPIREDVRAESHYSCAICGSMDNGEVAHIEAVATTLNNSPDNLLLLCPNHHRKYDLGHAPASNIDIEVIHAAKRMKRESRKRMLRYETNACGALRGILALVKKFETGLRAELSDHERQAMDTELGSLLAAVPKICEAAEESAKKDMGTDAAVAVVAQAAPRLSRLAAPAAARRRSEAQNRSTARSLVEQAADVFVDIDEVDCPRCNGRGTTGLVGDFCTYCHGSCVVSTAKAEAYDEEDIDEVDCPRCNGRGTTGLVNDFCAYCHGNCLVSTEKAEAYDEEDIDEVDCPHCNGYGTRGLRGDFCALCKGSCAVSKDKALAYRKKYSRRD